MQLLLDTNVLIALLEEELTSLPRGLQGAVRDTANALHASVASLWEIAIKGRLGKLPLRTPLLEIPSALSVLEVQLVTIEAAHVLADLVDETDTRDPFDRLLLAQCQVEGFRLVTTDRVLAGHPLAWGPHTE